MVAQARRHELSVAHGLTVLVPDLRFPDLTWLEAGLVQLKLLNRPD
jgi:hypothetical protein